MRVYELGETFLSLTVDHPNRSQLDYRISLGIEPGGLSVNRNERTYGEFF